LSDIGEDALIRRLVGGLDQGGNVVVGPGDDCAVIDIGKRGEFQLLKTDALVEGVHYLPEAPAEQVGWKAVARVLSDFAAMGGTPAQLLITIALPGTQSVSYVESLYRGMVRCASLFGAVICGGETTAVPDGSAAVISVAGTGWVKSGRLVRRGGGRAGDVVLVTGTLGGSITGKHLNFTPRLKEAEWLTSHFQLHAMMDLSDGLARDLPRMAKVSGCGYEIDRSRLPCNPGCDASQALGDGEDYELLFTVGEEVVPELLDAWPLRFPDLPLSVVGGLTQLNQGEDESGEPLGGWEHF